MHISFALLIASPGFSTVHIKIKMDPKEFAKLDLLSIRLLIMPLIDYRYDVKNEYFKILCESTLKGYDVPKWSASNPLIVEPYLRNFEELHFLLMKLDAIMSGRDVASYVVRKMTFWAFDYDQTRGGWENFLAWVESKKERWFRILDGNTEE